MSPFKKYLAFKITQYNRMQKIPLKGDELRQWIESQFENKTDLIKGFIREALAKGIIDI